MQRDTKGEELMTMPCDSTLAVPAQGDAFTEGQQPAGAGGVAPLGAIFVKQCENEADIRIVARKAGEANANYQFSSETLLAAALSLPAADRARLVAHLRAGARKAIRPDYRRQVTISMEEACDLTGLARQTIANAIWRGRVKRAGVGRYYIDQGSLLKALTRKRKVSA